MTTIGDPDRYKKNILAVVKRFQDQKELDPEAIFDLVVEFHDDTATRQDVRSYILTMICDGELVVTTRRTILTPEFAQKEALAVRLDPLAMDFPTFLDWASTEITTEQARGCKVKTALHGILSCALHNRVFGVPDKTRKS